MSYQIIIKNKSLQTIPPKQEFNKISDTGGRDGGAKYDYVTKPESQQMLTEEVYNQTVDNIDIIAVIAAINNLELPKGS